MHECVCVHVCACSDHVCLGMCLCIFRHIQEYMSISAQLCLHAQTNTFIYRYLEVVICLCIHVLKYMNTRFYANTACASMYVGVNLKIYTYMQPTNVNRNIYLYA